MQFARHCPYSYGGNKFIFNLYPQNETYEEVVIIQGTMCEMVSLEFILFPQIDYPIKKITFSVVIRMKTWKMGSELEIKGWMYKVLQSTKDGTGWHSAKRN